MDDSYSVSIKTKYDDVINSSHYSDILIVVIICIIMIVVLVKYLFAVNSQTIINNWDKRRCDPDIIPFAGLINAPEGTSAFDYAAENFSYCVNKVLKERTNKEFAYVNADISNIETTLTNMTTNITDTREDASQFRENTSDTFEKVYNTLNDVTATFAITIEKMKDVLNKTNAALLTRIYTMKVGIITMDSIILNLYENIVKFLWTIHAFIISCFTLGVLYPSTIASGVAASSFLSMMIVPLVSFVSIMDAINPDGSTAPFTPMPSAPSNDRRNCFSGSTLISTKHDGNIMIKHLVLGQELLDGSIVTALTKSTATDSTLYRLGRTIVTGTHKVFDTINGWVDVSEYRNKILVKNFKESYVYCIGTSSKIIKIDDLIFSDWDELDDIMIKKLCGDTISKCDIHKVFDVGLHPDTLIQLQSGRYIKIKDVDINDKLICGASVETVIKVKTDDINEFCETKYNTGLTILSTKNTEIIHGGTMTFVSNSVPPPELCYHIVTDRGGFKLSDVFISDYNRGIEKFFA